MHFTWYEFFLGIEYKKAYLAASFFVTGVVILASISARLALGSGETAVLPANRFSIKGFFEFLTESIYGLCEMLFGHHDAPKYVAHFSAIFFFILLANLMGLLPGMVASTANINAALAIGLVSFVFYNILGVKHGGWHYVAHFFGPIIKWYALPLMLLMFAIEIISHMVRPLSLGMRLSINMTADHTILGTFIELTKLVIPVIFYGMGTFVSLLQAFVFTLLSMVYVMLAMGDEH